MMQWYLQFFSLVLCLLISQHVCQASSDCQTPTEDKEISICSYCSDSRAGVRWAVHPSTKDKYPEGPFRLIISFRCNHTQNMIDITEDACFNGGFVRRLIYLTDPSIWRWHILGRQLPEGTQCQFTTTVRDGETRTMSRLQMSTSCTIGDNNSSPVMPATCQSESVPVGCPCRCSDGFRIDEPGDMDVSDSLTCKNIDECSEGNHDCINASGCVDTEGGHYCLTSTTMEPTSTPSTMVTPSSTTSGTTPDLEPTTETDITVTLSAGPSSTTVTSDTFTMSLSATSASHGIETTGSISSINTLSATTTYGTEMTTAESLMTTTGHGTETRGTRKSTPNDLILGIVLGIILFIVFVTIVMMISIIVTRKNYFHLQTKKLNSKIKKFPQGLAIDSFDPNFRPVAIEKIDSISTETMSFKSIFDPLYYGKHNVLPPSGSVRTLNIDEIN